VPPIADVPKARRPATLLVLSQVYVPDPASVGQHMADAAAEMVRRGHRVVVLTARRGYDDPSVRYAKREVLDGVEVSRLPLSSLGKGSIPIRLLGGALFLAQAVIRGLFLRRLDFVLVSTSPPMCGLAALAIAAVRRVPIKYWVMDLNPDQMIALGKLRESSVLVRLFDAFNRAILRRADDVVALDRFMAERLLRKEEIRGALAVLPPWPLEDHLEPVPREENPFRQAHGLTDRFVVMYSGNHGPSNPVGTILRAAERLRSESSLVFAFVGGGIGKVEIEETIRRGASNVLSLPYQPLSQIRYSLSAADVHLVTVGDAVVGIVHPCKVYGAMAVGRPIVLLGPCPCHVSDLIDAYRIGWRIEHGDVDGAVRTLREIRATPPAELARMGERAREAVRAKLSKHALCGGLCDVLERGVIVPRSGGQGSSIALRTDTITWT
jgi:glycosyltransferase involved in cell wall biosynthesis